MENGSSSWTQIARADGRSVILDLSDPDPGSGLYRRKGGDDGERDMAPKIAAILVKYDLNKPEGQRSERMTHYVDEPKLAVLMHDILNGRKGAVKEKDGRRVYDPILTDYKGGQDRDVNAIVSRQLRVTYNDGLDMGPVYEFSFKKCDGERNKQGAVIPRKNGKSYFEGVIRVGVEQARIMAMEVLLYLQAKKTTQVQEARSRPEPGTGPSTRPAAAAPVPASRPAAPRPPATRPAASPPANPSAERPAARPRPVLTSGEGGETDPFLAGLVPPPAPAGTR